MRMAFFPNCGAVSAADFIPERVDAATAAFILSITLGSGPRQGRSTFIVTAGPPVLRRCRHHSVLANADRIAEIVRAATDHLALRLQCCD
jgi:hypothetical protein